MDDWRERLRRVGGDPLGDMKSEEISKKKFEQLLMNGSPEAAGVVHGAIEEFASELAVVIRRFLRTKGWHDTERVVVGGGFRREPYRRTCDWKSARDAQAEGIAIELVPIRHHPDDAGLLGAAHLMPLWTLTGYDALLAVDIGGTNIRAGVVALNHKKASDLSRAEVHSSDLWRHADYGPDREQSIARLVEMLKKLISVTTTEKLRIAPFIGVGCPGIIEADGSITRGGQNLPGGNWKTKNSTSQPRLLTRSLTIGDHKTMVMIHNDAVVQGLSEIPFMQDVTRWAVATIGTGLGNARFSNRSKEQIESSATGAAT